MRRGLRGVVLAAGALLAVQAAAGAPAGAAELRGQLDLVDAQGRPVQGVDTARSVVYYQPATGATPAPKPGPSPLEVVTRGKQFEPRVLPVRVGSRVRFPNADPILHNVFSVSPGNAFDLGLARQGAGKDVTFTRPGLVRVFCNVHHSMVAYVLVLDTPYFTSPDAGGSFALTGLPAGEGTLTAWHEQADPQSLTIRVPPATPAPLVIRLAATKPRVPPHLNKAGRSYRHPRGDRYDR